MTTPARDTAAAELADVMRDLANDLVLGLTRAEAARRLEREGRNELQAAPSVPAWRKLLAQFQEPLIYLVLAAVVVATLAWWVEGGDGWPVDSVVIALVVLLHAVLGYSQEVQVPAREVVRGDLLVLGEATASPRTPGSSRPTPSGGRDCAHAESTAASRAPGTLAAGLPLGGRTNSVFGGERPRRALADVEEFSRQAM